MKSVFFFFSGTDSSLHSPTPVSAHHIERVKKVPAELKWRKGEEETRTEEKADNSSIEEEVPIAANDSICSDSIPSAVDEKGTRWQAGLLVKG